MLDEKERKVFVVNLSHEITEGRLVLTVDDLKDYFSQFGEIEEVRIIKNKEENVMRGFGFILFYDRVSYNKVFELSETHKINGRQVVSNKLDRMQESFVERRASKHEP